MQFVWKLLIPIRTLSNTGSVGGIFGGGRGSEVGVPSWLDSSQYMFFSFSHHVVCVKVIQTHIRTWRSVGGILGEGRGSAEVWGVPSWLGSSHLLVPSWLIPSQPPGAGHSQTNSHSLQCDFHSWTKQTWIQIEIQIRKHKIYKFLRIWFLSGQSRDSYIQKNYSICHNRQCQCHDFTNWITTKIFNKISL